MIANNFQSPCTVLRIWPCLADIGNSCLSIRQRSSCFEGAMLKEKSTQGLRLPWNTSGRRHAKSRQARRMAAPCGPHSRQPSLQPRTIGSYSPEKPKDSANDGAAGRSCRHFPPGQKLTHPHPHPWWHLKILSHSHSSIIRISSCLSLINSSI